MRSQNGKRVPYAQSGADVQGEPGGFLAHICEVSGFAASIAWLPFVLTGRVLGNPNLVAMLPARVQGAFGELGDLVPLGICLIVCVMFGFAVASLADFIDSESKIQLIWLAGAVLAVLSFPLHGHLASAVTLALSYSVIIVLWRLFMANKTLRARAMINATLACAALLAACALLDSVAASFLPCVLLCISYALSVPTMPEMLERWRPVKRKAMLMAGLPWRRLLYSAATHLITGIAYGILVLSTSMEIGVISAGGAYLVAYLWVNVRQRTELELTQAQFRGFVAVAVLLLFIAALLAPGAWRGVAALLVAGLIISEMLNTAIAQAALEKDKELSDVFYFGLRHAFNTLGTGVGFMGFCATATVFGFDSVATCAVLGCAAFLIILAAQISTGFYGKRASRAQEEPDIVKVYVDSWREKVVRVAAAHDLTERQTDIFDALSRGRNTKYIMGRLYLSEGTVKKQSHQIYRKLNVHNQQDLITMVMTASLDDGDASSAVPDLMAQWDEQQRRANGESSTADRPLSKV